MTDQTKRNVVDEFIHDVDFIGNNTDKRRKNIVRRLKKILSDIRVRIKKKEN